MKYWIQFFYVFSWCVFGIQNVCSAQIKAFSSPTSLEWESFEHGLQRAAQENKMVMLAFHGESCPFTKKMKEDVYSKPDLQRLINTYFIPVEIFLHNDQSVWYNGVEIKVDNLATIFKVEGTPTLTFLNEEGDLIAFQPGYLSPKLFAKLMEYVGKGLYATMSFAEFSEKKN